jgi:hypothetical protein
LKSKQQKQSSFFYYCSSFFNFFFLNSEFKKNERDDLLWLHSAIQSAKIAEEEKCDEQKVLQINVKKLFSNLTEKKEKKETNKKVDKEKAKMEKIMKESGIVGLNQKEQQELVANNRTSGSNSNNNSSGNIPSVSSVDKEPLFFLRFVIGGSVKRNSNFFLASEPAAKEDVVNLPWMEGQIEVEQLCCVVFEMFVFMMMMMMMLMC